jgi:hypothetical protein
MASASSRFDLGLKLCAIWKQSGRKHSRLGGKIGCVVNHLHPNAAFIPSEFPFFAISLRVSSTCPSGGVMFAGHGGGRTKSMVFPWGWSVRRFCRIWQACRFECSIDRGIFRGGRAGSSWASPKPFSDGPTGRRAATRGRASLRIGQERVIREGTKGHDVFARI